MTMKGLMSMPNHIHKRSLRWIFTFSLICSASIVHAAQYHWQGPYLGAFVGGGFGNNATTTDVGIVSSTSYFTNSSDINSVNSNGSKTRAAQSAIIGIDAGHDWTLDRFVYGVMFDYSSLPLNSSTNASNISYSSSGLYTVYTSVSADGLFTLRGRLGYSTVMWPSSLFYFTGGLGLTRITVKNNFTDTTSLSATGGTQTSQHQVGWTTGVGVEIAPFRHGSFYFEYLYLQFPSVKNISSITNSQEGFGVPAQSMTSPFTTTGKIHANLIKFGMNYKFDE